MRAAADIHQLRGARRGRGQKASGSTSAAASMAAVAAGPVFRLLGKKDLGTSEFPEVETGLTDGDLAFRQHKGGHTTGPNWPTFLAFADRYIQVKKASETSGRLKGRISQMMTSPGRRPPTRLLALVVVALTGAGARGDESHWVGTWAAAPQLTEPRNMPPEPGLADATLRQVVHVSLGGKRLRVRFSNAFGTKPLTILAAHAAHYAGDGAIKAEGAKPLAFGGRASVTIPTGAPMISDTVDFNLAPLSDLVVTIRVKDPTRAVTGHPGARCTSWLHARRRADRTNAAEGGSHAALVLPVRSRRGDSDRRSARLPCWAIRSPTAGARRRTATDGGRTTSRRGCRRAAGRPLAF